MYAHIITYLKHHLRRTHSGDLRVYWLYQDAHDHYAALSYVDAINKQKLR